VAFNPDNTYTAHLFVRQRLYAAPHYYQNVPIQITFFDSQLNPYTETFVVSGGCTQVATTLPFYPVYAALDWNQLLNDATTDQHLTLNQTGTIAFDDEKMSVTVSSYHRLDFTACVAPLGNARPLRHPKPQLKAIA
jgi:hypothetical protein